MSALVQSDCPDLSLIARGKVRDLYDIDEQHVLFVATDRISAYDVVMKNGIPGKGKVLTQLSVFWFEQLAAVAEHHLIATEMADMPSSVQAYADQLQDRCMLVKKLEILPVEAIVRGYISGSGWREYEANGTVHGVALPAGLQESQELPEPLFTPSTKAEQGNHDENIHPDKTTDIIGAERAATVSSTALALYSKARSLAAEKGIIIADTKFEFGVNKDGKVILADEVLTPDSSRFWPAADYAIGRGQDSYDKQYVRDYLTSINFDKTNPVALPDEVCQNTIQKYIEAYSLLTGKSPNL